MSAKQALSISDLMAELNCSLDRARDIVLNELPHADISMVGSKKPSWRVKRRDFDKWMAAREEAAGNERLAEFAQRHMA